MELTWQGKLAVFLIWTGIAFTAGWLASNHWNLPVIVPLIAHAQVALPGGGLEASRDALPVNPAQQLQAGQKAHASFSVSAKPSRPIYVPAPLPQTPAVASGAAQASIPDKSPASTPAPALPAPPSDCTGYISHLECPAITIQGTEVIDKDGEPDLLLSSAGAQLAEAHLHVITPVTVAPIHPWAVGITKDPVHIGGFIDRDLGPIRVGIELEQGRVAARLGWRF